MTSLFSDLVAISPGLGLQAVPGQTQTAPGLVAEAPPGLMPEAMPFARIFADLVQQNAPAQPLDQLNFQAVNLGPSLQLITVAASAPDEASLARFAMSQGIGEPAIRYLLGDKAAMKGMSPSIPDNLDETQGIGQPAEISPAPGPGPGSIEPLSGELSSDFIAFVAPVNAPAAEAGRPAEMTRGPRPGPGLGPGSIEPLSEELSSDGEEFSSDDIAFLASSALIGQRTSAGLAQAVNQALNHPVSQSPSQPSESAELLPLAVRGLGPVVRQPPAPFESSPPKSSLLESSLVRAPLAQQQGLQANVNAPTAEAEIEIDLEALLAPSRQNKPAGSGGKAAPAQDWLASRVAADLGRAEPGNPGQSGLLAADLKPGNDRSHLPEPKVAANPMPDDAAADYELLSRRLGEAIAQRLVQQIERGQWQIQFKLTPKSLGDVRVDLQMRNGALEATLVASQSMTRDLLNDGLTRLRDALSASGMDVAYLSVGSDGSRQNGGKPTPGQMLQHGRDQRIDAAETEGKAFVSTPSSMGGNSGGWDVLV